MHRTRQPHRRSSERGAVMIVFALSMAFIITAVAMGVDHGRITTNRRNLQKVADLVALDTSRELDGGTTAELRPDVEHAILDSAIRNQFIDSPAYTFTNGVATLGSDRRIKYVLGTYDVDSEVFTATADDERPNAVRLSITDGIGYFFQPGDSTSTMDATAMTLLPQDECVEPDPDCPREPYASAAFNLGSFVASFEATAEPLDELRRQARHQKAKLLNAVVGDLLGDPDQAKALQGPTNPPHIPDTDLALDVVGYQGLAQTWVTIDQLRAAMGFGTVTELLEAEVDMPDFINGLADALALPDPPGIPLTGNSRIDGRLAELAAEAPAGYDVTPFEDPSASAVHASDEELTLVAINSLGEVGQITQPGQTFVIEDNLVIVETGHDYTVADAEINVLDALVSAAFINGENLVSAETFVPVSSPHAPTLNSTLSSLGIIDEGLEAAGLPAGGGLYSLLSKQVDKIEKTALRPKVVEAYQEAESTFPAASELLYAELKFHVIEKPQFVAGPPGFESGLHRTSVETSQVNATLELVVPAVDLAEILGPAGVPLTALTENYTDMTVPFVLSGAQGFAGLNSIDCDFQAGTPTTFDVSTDLLYASIGTPVDLGAAPPVIDEAVLLTTDLDTGLLGLGLTTIDLVGRSEIPPIAGTDGQVTVSAPYNSENRTRISHDPVEDIGSTLVTQLQASVDSALILDPGVIPQRVRNELDKRLPKLESQVLGPLADVMGVGLAGADLTVTDVDCGLNILIED